MKLNVNIGSHPVYNNTREALRLLIQNSYYLQSTYVPDPQCPPPISDIQLLKEFCTIKMCTARRSGHTTAILDVGEEFFDSFLYLGPNLRMVEYVKGTAKLNKINYTNGVYPQIHYGSFGGNLSLLRELNFEAIFVDTTFSLKPSIIDEIYDLATGMCLNPYKFVIFIE